jgi:hypothetical protein
MEVGHHLVNLTHRINISQLSLTQNHIRHHSIENGMTDWQLCQSKEIDLKWKTLSASFFSLLWRNSNTVYKPPQRFTVVGKVLFSNSGWKAVTITDFRNYLIPYIKKSRDSSVGVAMVYGLGCQRSNPGRIKILLFLLSRTVVTHPASYIMDTRGDFPGGKVAGAERWPLTSV